MRRIGYLLLSIWLVGPQTVWADLNIFACEPEWKALAEEIGGDKVEVFSATTAAQDPHHIQARPSLIAKLRRADLLICSGADLEAGWLPLLLRRARNPKVQPGWPGHLLAADHLSLLEVPENLDRAEGHIHAQGNPHVHLDPQNILALAGVLAQRLAEIDAQNGADYRSAQEAFRERWSAAMRDWEARAGRLRGESVVVNHREWTYLLHWLGMRRLAALEPKPGVPPSAGHLAALLTRLESERPLAILRSTISDPGPSEWLAKRSGISTLALPYTVGSTEEANDLFTLFDQIIERLLEVGS